MSIPFPRQRLQQLRLSCHQRAARVPRGRSTSAARRPRTETRRRGGAGPGAARGDDDAEGGRGGDGAGAVLCLAGEGNRASRKGVFRMWRRMIRRGPVGGGGGDAEPEAGKCGGRGRKKDIRPCWRGGAGRRETRGAGRGVLGHCWGNELVVGFCSGRVWILIGSGPLWDEAGR